MSCTCCGEAGRGRDLPSTVGKPCLELSPSAPPFSHPFIVRLANYLKARGLPVGKGSAPAICDWKATCLLNPVVPRLKNCSPLLQSPPRIKAPRYPQFLPREPTRLDRSATCWQASSLRRNPSQRRGRQRGVNRRQARLQFRLTARKNPARRLLPLQRLRQSRRKRSPIRLGRHKTPASVCFRCRLFPLRQQIRWLR